MYKNFIFDFGQVIVKFDPEFMTKVYIENPNEVKAVEDIIFDRLYWDKLDEGTITDGEVKEGICSRVPEHLKEKACLVYDNWYENIPFIEGMPELLKEIKQNGGKLFLLSNISKGFAENYKRVPQLKALFDLFDGLVFSGPIGIIKPSKEIFNYLLEKYSLKADETVFIDDNKNNTEGSIKAGINSILFDGDVASLKLELFKGENNG